MKPACHTEGAWSESGGQGQCGARASGCGKRAVAGGRAAVQIRRQRRRRAGPSLESDWRPRRNHLHCTTVSRANLLSASDIAAALEALAAELLASGERHELILVGGAAVALGFGGSRSTRDVDVYELDPKVKAAAVAVASKLGLSNNWLSDDARLFMARVSRGKRVVNGPSLTVTTASAEQLLAMKLCAGRDEADFQDAALLMRVFQCDRDELRLRLEPYWVSGKQRRGLENFEDLWEDLHDAG